jgi:hypothetical protein
VSNSVNFFKDIQPLKSFSEVVDSSKHIELPDDWFVIITDVLGSTKAIETGKYKQVNTVGACTIMAIKNVNRDIDIPYVFGGDGATLAIPPEMEAGCRNALLGAQKLARDGFSLDLRIGIVPVSFLRSKDCRVNIIKHQVSEHIVQAAITGRGWEYAEELVKGPDTRADYEVVETEKYIPDADFSGFECRWQEIKSRKDHKNCLLVLSMKVEPEEKITEYQEIINKILEIYGPPSEHHPLKQETLKLCFNPMVLMGEAMVQTDRSYWAMIKYVSKMLFQNILGTYFFWKKIDTEAVEWSQYQGDVVNNSDYRKFDGMLKMVLDGSKGQENEIREYFEQKYQRGEIVYGIHTATSALLTCLVFSHDKDHAHFVDASEGGYAMAAKYLKKRLKEFKSKIQ